MGVLVPIRTLVMALVGWIGHHHVGDLTWAPRIIIMMIMVVAVWVGYQHTGDHSEGGCVGLSFELVRPHYLHEQTWCMLIIPLTRISTGIFFALIITMVVVVEVGNQIW